MNGPAQITVKNKKTGDKRVYRLDQQQAAIGREPSNYVSLDGKTVSRRHAEILQEGNQFFLRDLKSNNGTLLNDQKLRPHEKSLLRSGDRIQIEEYDLQFHVPNAQDVEDIYEITDTDLLEVKMVKKLLRAMDRDSAPSFEVLDGPHAGIRFILEAKTQDILIGRDPACEFVIDSEVVSRKHARVEKRFDTVVLYDLKSRNGTFVNREPIEEKTLHDGDVVHLGTLTLSFHNPQELTFDFEPPQISQPHEDEKSKESSAEPQPNEDASANATPSSLPQPRSSRKRGTEISKKEVPPPPPEPQPEPQPPPEPTPPAEPPPEPPLDSPPEEQPEEKGLALGGFQLSPVEIAAIVVGFIVLIGSIWGIVKLLG